MREDYLDLNLHGQPSWMSREDRLAHWWKSASFGVGLEGKAGRAVGNAEDAVKAAKRVYDSAQRSVVHSLSESGLSIRKIGEAVSLSKSKVARILNERVESEPGTDDLNFESAKMRLSVAETTFRIVKHQAVYANLDTALSLRSIAEGLRLPKMEVWYMAALMSGTSGVLSDVSFSAETGVAHADDICEAVLNVWGFSTLADAVQDFPRGAWESTTDSPRTNFGGLNG